MGVLVDHEGAFRASLQAEYGIRLLPGGQGRTEPERTMLELADLLEHLPPGTALARDQGGEAALTQESTLLHAIEFNQRAGMYSQAGGKGKKPEPLPLPESAAEQRAERAAMDAKARAWKARQARRAARPRPAPPDN